MSIDMVKLRARLRSLMAMTVENGCTEAEAMTAADKVAALLKEHGLDEAAIGQAEFVEIVVPLGRSRRSDVDGLWSLVAYATFCEIWQRSGEAGIGIVYFGREPDALVAEYLHALLTSAVEREAGLFRKSKAYLRRRTARTRRLALTAFRAGLVDGLQRRLVSLAWKRIPVEVERLAKAGETKVALQARNMSFGTVRPMVKKTIPSTFQDERRSGMGAAGAVSMNSGVGTEPVKQIGGTR